MITDIELKQLIRITLSKSISYSDYRKLLEQWAQTNQTSGIHQSEELSKYTNLNFVRTSRLDKTIELSNEVKEIINILDRPLVMLALTEAWCGDAAQILPVLNKFTCESNKLQLRLVFRDEHFDLMDQFLTNGGRSIPKIIFIDAKSHVVLDSWGPRPKAAQQIFMNYKNNPKRPPYADYQKELHGWYAKDKTVSTQAELIEILNKLVP